MGLRTADRAFARFAASGEAKALATVFDRTAPELLRVARFLTADGHRAEDAVQEVFLIALRKASTWDRERSVMSWLMGILARVAHDARRRDTRRRTEHDDAAVEAGAAPFGRTPAEEAPAAAAERRELEAALDRALDALDEPYRQACVLHLRHGLRAVEIADALQMNAATVRTRLHRGLERLRRSLPAGFAAGTAFWLSGGTRALAAIRAEVLAAAGVSVTAAAVTSGGGVVAGVLGVIMMKQTMMVAATAVVVAALSVWLGGGGAIPEPSPVAAEDGGAHVTSSSDGAVSSGTMADGEPSRAAVDPSVAAQAGARLAVAVKFARDGSAAVDIGVSIWPAEGADVVRTARTDAAGSVQFADLPPGDWQIECDHGASASVRVAAGEDARRDLEIARGRSVTCRVVDALDAPAANASVFTCARLAQHRAILAGTTDAAGMLTLSDCIAETLFARRAGEQPSRPRSFVGKQLDAEQIEVELQLGPTCSVRITGEILDAAGLPVARALIAAIPVDAARDGEVADPDDLEFEGHDILFLRADAEGRFDVDELPTATTLFAARSPDDNDPRIAVTSRDLRGAGAHVVMTLGAGATVSGRVLDASGSAQSGRRIKCSWHAVDFRGGAEAAFGRMFRDLEAVTDANGEYRIEGAPPSAAKLRVDATDVKTRATLAAGQHLVWSPVIEGRSLTVRVVDKNGDPLENWAIALIETPADANAFDYRWNQRLTGADGRYQAIGLDADRFEVRAYPPNADGQPGVIPAARERSVPSDGREITLVAGRTASTQLRALVVDADGAPVAKAKLGCSPTWVTGVREDVVSGADGSIARRGLLDGIYRLTLRASGQPRTDLGEHELSPDRVTDLGTIEFAPVTRLTVRLRGPDDLPIPRAVVTLVDDRGRTRLRRNAGQPGSYALSDDALVPPGRYRLHLQSAVAAPSVKEVELVRGENSLLQRCGVGTLCEFDVRLPPSGLRGSIFARLEVRDAGGQVVWSNAMHSVEIADATRRHATVEACLERGNFVAVLTDEHFDRSVEVGFTLPTPKPIVLKVR